MFPNPNSQRRSTTAEYRDSVAGQSRALLAPCISRLRLPLLTSAVVNALERFSEKCGLILLLQRCGHWTRPAKRCLSELCSANIPQSEFPASKHNSRYPDSVAGQSRALLAPCISRLRLPLLTSAVVNALERFSEKCGFILLLQRCGHWTRPAKRCLSELCSANVPQSEFPASKHHSGVSRLCCRAKPSVVGSMHLQTPVAAADQRCRQCP